MFWPAAVPHTIDAGLIITRREKMTNLADEMNVSPRQRITIPENSRAIILSNEMAREVKSMCLIIRRGKKIGPETRHQMQSIAGDLLLAIVEAE